MQTREDIAARQLRFVNSTVVHRQDQILRAFVESSGDRDGNEDRRDIPVLLLRVLPSMAYWSSEEGCLMGRHVTMACGWGCGQSFGARAIAAHFARCPNRPNEATRTDAKQAEPMRTETNPNEPANVEQKSVAPELSYIPDDGTPRPGEQWGRPNGLKLYITGRTAKSVTFTRRPPGDVRAIEDCLTLAEFAKLTTGKLPQGDR